MSSEEKIPFGPSHFFDPTNHQPRAGKSALHDQILDGAAVRADQFLENQVGKIKLPVINATCELGHLLVFVADVATAIRMNSPYNGAYLERDPREVGLDVMWLADALHCLDRLGRAIQSADNKETVAACDSLLSYYTMFTEGVQGKNMMGDPKATFERFGHLCNPQQAMAVLSEIRGKALAQ